MAGAGKNVDGALEEKEIGSLVGSYVWKLKVLEFRKDKGRYPVYLGMMML
jgi:hypothetical protein